ncbi:MAG: AIR carboxylase family protein, partial [Bacteroidetes bacterium]|nr:AIR carboxylase family protein [Bacteroidota bacterium]
MKSQGALIEIRTGSDSDIPKISEAYEFFESVGIPYSPRILSAHRTPQVMAAEAMRLSDNGFFVSIAAAGGLAHLPGMTASETVLPVVGLPVTTSN